MSITLARIWALSLEDLLPILASRGHKASGNLGYDRAIAATIHHNSGTLVGSGAEWVTYHSFVEVMSNALTWEAGIQILQEPVLTKLMIFSSMKDAAMILVRNGISSRCAEPYSVQNADATSGAMAMGFDGVASGGCGAIDGVMRRSGDNLPYTEVCDMLFSDVKTSEWKITVSNAAPDVMGIMAATATWRLIVNLHAELSSPIKMKPRPIINGIKTAVKALLSLQVPYFPRIGKCYWLYSVWEILKDFSPDISLTKKLDALIVEHKCEGPFSAVPIVITEGLEGLVGTMGGSTRLHLSSLVGGYAARPPTREEVMRRLLTLS